MTDREMVLYLIKKMNKTYCEYPKSIEIDRWIPYCEDRRDITFEFDENDNLIEIYS